MMNEILVRKLLDSGVMISPDAAAEITDRDYDTVVARSLKVVDMETLSEIRTTGDITITWPETAREEITTKDYLNYYRNKIRVLGKFIVERLDEEPVSMNRARFGQRNTILGIVREPSESGFFLEDLTGRCEVPTRTREDVAENDVVAVTGFFSDNKLFPDKITYPELPIKKTIKFSDKECSAFFVWPKNTETAVNNIAAGNKEAFVFVFRDESDDCTVFHVGGGKIISEAVLPAASSAVIRAGNADFSVQNLRAGNAGNVESQAKFFAKRRYVSNDRTAPVFSADPFVIEQDTDIILLGKTGSTGVANHKGRTFVAVGCAGDGEPAAKIDLKTRLSGVASF